MIAIALAIGSYILGSIPFGLLVAHAWAGIDVREHGSGNIGATNVYRVVSKPAGVCVFLLDVLKGLTPPLVASSLGLSSYWQVGLAMLAIFGHSFSPFLGFHGGKGIATSLGALFGIAWKVGLTAWALWGVVLALTGYVSLGSVLAAASLAPFALAYHPGDTVRLVFMIVAGVLAILRHRANIARLVAGTESTFRKTPPSRHYLLIVTIAACAVMAFAPFVRTLLR